MANTIQGFQNRFTNQTLNARPKLKMTTRRSQIWTYHRAFIKRVSIVSNTSMVDADIEVPWFRVRWPTSLKKATRWTNLLSPSAINYVMFYWSVPYAENFHGGGFIQWHRVVICICCALFVTSQFDVIVLFPNQRFSEVRWQNMHVFLYIHSPYFMCHCTEYNLLALQVRLSEENAPNATIHSS